MKKFFTIFFVTLGVIFFIILLLASYFFIADPLELKPLLFGEAGGSVAPVDTAEDRNSLLSEEQETALERIGVDPASLPSEITDAQLECFTAVLGAPRVAEIEAGAIPTATEFFKARSCLDE